MTTGTRPPERDKASSTALRVSGSSRTWPAKGGGGKQRLDLALSPEYPQTEGETMMGERLIVGFDIPPTYLPTYLPTAPTVASVVPASPSLQRSPICIDQHN